MLNLSDLYTIDDLPREQTARAYSWVSFVPDERGERTRQEYVNDLDDLAARLGKLATTPEQEAIARAEFLRYRAGYLEKFGALLHATSRCASSAVTGPSNFPSRQMEKRNDTEHKRRGEFLEWRERARNAIVKRLMDARPAEMIAEAAWDRLRKDIMGNMATVKGIDNGASFYTRSAFTTSVSGKLERLAANGERALVRRALDFIREQQASMPKPFFAARNAVWTLGEVAEAVAAEPEQTGEEIIAEAGDVRAIANHDEDRVQIIFPGKPDSDTIRRLKGSGWNWSPRNQAWQRKLTVNARCDAKQIVESTPCR